MLDDAFGLRLRSQFSFESMIALFWEPVLERTPKAVERLTSSLQSLSQCPDEEMDVQPDNGIGDQGTNRRTVDIIRSQRSATVG